MSQTLWYCTLPLAKRKRFESKETDMKSVIKISLGVIFTLLLLVVVAILALNFFIDADQYKNTIRTIVKENTGLTLDIEGPLELSFFPSLGFSANKLSVTTPKEEKLVLVDYAQVEVELFPLLSNELKVTALNIEGAEVNLVKDKKGVPNWQIETTQSQNKPASKTTPAETSDQGSNTTSNTGKSTTELNISAVSLKNITLNYQDQQKSQTFNLKNLNVSASNIANNQYFPIQVSFSASGNQPAFKLDEKVRTDFLFDLKQQRFELKEFSLNSQGQLTAEKQPFAIDLDVSAEKIELASQAQQINIKNLALSDKQLMAKSNVSLTNFIQPTVKGNISLSVDNLPEWLQGLGINYKPTKLDALNKFSFTSQINGDAGNIVLDKLNLTAGDFTLNGKVTLANITKQPRYEFDVKGSDLVVDHFTPATSSTTSSSASTTQSEKNESAKTSSPVKTADNTPILPIDTLRQLNLKGKLHLNSLTQQKTKLEDVNLSIHANNGNIQLSPVTAKTLGGTINKTVAIDVTKKTPIINVTTKANNINVHQALMNYADLNAIKGAANLTGQFSTKGNTKTQLIESLNGQANFAIANGELTQTNVDKILCKAIAKVRKEKVSKKDWGTSTPFQDMSGQIIIRNGVVDNQKLIAKLEQLNIDGYGTVNLLTESLDYRLGLTITGSQSNAGEEACQINKRYANIRWPIRCQGVFSDKELCGIDQEKIGEIAASQVKSELERKIDKKLEDKPELKPVGDLLKRFLD
ncbi:AsmA family protein [Zooshikella ganghwensis]|uniref:AsmA family protein n=2 Tax=Zooshikella ganghwensis TaxID=202772 RepID=A0A4P9VST9_9GAMM|nr:AsmA family protein [Zooshikella ganghwensis]